MIDQLRKLAAKKLSEAHIRLSEDIGNWREAVRLVESAAKIAQHKIAIPSAFTTTEINALTTRAKRADYLTTLKLSESAIEARAGTLTYAVRILKEASLDNERRIAEVEASIRRNNPYPPAFEASHTGVGCLFGVLVSFVLLFVFFAVSGIPDNNRAKETNSQNIFLMCMIWGSILLGPLMLNGIRRLLYEAKVSSVTAAEKRSRESARSAPAADPERFKAAIQLLEQEIGRVADKCNNKRDNSGGENIGRGQGNQGQQDNSKDKRRSGDMRKATDGTDVL